jgi:drug/metabolite transporter (DMT)-like permease
MSASPARPPFGLTDVGLVAMAVIWGVNYSVVKEGLRVLPPLTFNATRMLLASAVLLGIASAVRSTPWPSGRVFWRLAALGLVGNGAYQLLFILGLARTRAGVAALVAAAGPAWIAIVSRLLGGERPSPRGWQGILLQLAGVGCVVASSGGQGDGAQGTLGALLIMVGSICWAVFSVQLQPLTQVTHPFHLSAVTMLSGALCLTAVAAPGIVRQDWGAVTPAAWGAVGYAGVFALVIAYLLFYRGVQVLGSTRTALYSNLQPVIALAVAWLLLGERPTGWQLVGTVLVVAGLLLSRLAPMRPPREAPASVRSASGGPAAGAAVADAGRAP